MRLIIAAAAIGLALAASADEKPTNYCHNESSNQEWADKAAKYHDSDIWQRLFALRIGLCTMVERDRLTVPRATVIFERARDRAVRDLDRYGDRDQLEM